MDYKYNYSFIIPHHNLPELLKRCVSSIPKRADVQIIIVDDNSDPSIVDFDNFPFLGEKNIEIIFDKSGKRQGHARNIGIERARGKWLIFADSDDFFLYSIHQALEENIDNEADIVHYMSTLLDNDTYLPYINQNNLPNNSIRKYLNGEAYGEHFVRFMYPAPWGKFIKASLVDRYKIRFAEIDRLEDVQFSYQCGYYANKIKVNPYAIYCYIKRSNTVTTQITKSSAYNLVKVCADYMIFLADKKMSESPTYGIMTDWVFDNIESMRRENNEFYTDSIEYLLKIGIPIDFIKKNIKRMKLIYLKKRILNVLKK